MKQWVTIGVPKIAVAAFALIKGEQPGDADLEFSKYVTFYYPLLTYSPSSKKISLAIEDSSSVSPCPDQVLHRAHAGLNSTNRERGVQFLRHLYTEEQMAAMWSSWGKDFEWLTKDIVYGMFYADDTVLGNLDTELITYTAIVSLGLGVTVPNHLGGLLRMGLSEEEIEGVTECGEIVAKWAGA